MADRKLFESLTEEHRRLDRLFGDLLRAIETRVAEDAGRAIDEFDEALRSHTRMEEEQVFRPLPETGLAPRPQEDSAARLSRELRLEHVQVRELSGMIRRLLSEKSGMDGARVLAANLARRWDAHTTREERELPAIISDST
jgi:hypothetical protein